MPKIIEDEDIFTATMRTVIERGYARATTKQIAEAANISEVTLFRKYGNKGQLVKQAIAKMVGQIDFESAARYTGNIREDVLRFVHLYQDSADRNGQFFYLMLTEIPRHPELADLLDAPLHIVNHIGLLLARYQEEGVLRHEHPLHAVAGLLGPIISTNMIRFARGDSLLPPLDLEEHVANYLYGRLLPGPNTSRHFESNHAAVRKE